MPDIIYTEGEGELYQIVETSAPVRAFTYIRNKTPNSLSSSIFNRLAPVSQTVQILQVIDPYPDLDDCQFSSDLTFPSLRRLILCFPYRRRFVSEKILGKRDELYCFQEGLNWNGIFPELKTIEISFDEGMECENPGTFNGFGKKIQDIFQDRVIHLEISMKKIEIEKETRNIFRFDHPNQIEPNASSFRDDDAFSSFKVFDTIPTDRCRVHLRVEQEIQGVSWNKVTQVMRDVGIGFGMELKDIEQNSILRMATKWISESNTTPITGVSITLIPPTLASRLYNLPFPLSDLSPSTKKRLEMWLRRFLRSHPNVHRPSNTLCFEYTCLDPNVLADWEVEIWKWKGMVNANGKVTTEVFVVETVGQDGGIIEEGRGMSVYFGIPNPTIIYNRHIDPVRLRRWAEWDREIQRERELRERRNPLLVRIWIWIRSWTHWIW